MTDWPMRKSCRLKCMCLHSIWLLRPPVPGTEKKLFATGTILRRACSLARVHRERTRSRLHPLRATLSGDHEQAGSSVGIVTLTFAAYVTNRMVFGRFVRYSKVGQTGFWEIA